MLRSVIFDLDGVLVDSHPLHLRAWKRLLASLGKSVGDGELEIILDGKKREELLQYFLGNLSEGQIEDYGKRKDQFFREEEHSLQTISGVRELLEELRGAAISLAVASAASRARVVATLDRLGLMSYFHAIVTGDQVSAGKPDPAIFRKAASQLRARPEESLVVEDSVSGVRAAKAAGMKCLGIATPPRAQTLLEAGADHVLPDFLDASVSEVQRLFP